MVIVTGAEVGGTAVGGTAVGGTAVGGAEVGGAVVGGADVAGPAGAGEVAGAPPQAVISMEVVRSNTIIKEITFLFILSIFLSKG